MDLRMTEWREAIVEIGNAIEKCPLTNRALAILIADCSKVKMTQAKEVLDTLPKLKEYYLKEE